MSMQLDFRPFPFLGNGHVQTVLGNLFPPPSIRFPTEERRVPLSDGDELLLHDSRPLTWQEGDPVALLVHGLGGSAASGYMQRVATRLIQAGVRAVRMDLRGCGGGLALARKPYHGGCSDDVRAAAAEVHRWSPASPLVLIGFSLGGNIALKLAGEAAADPVPGLERVAALAPPIDFARSADRLALPRHRLYELYFLRALLSQIRERQRYFPEDRAIRFPRRLTMPLFDDLYTSPRCGFRDHRHYYQIAASLPLIPQIRVPTFIMTARDDPFIDAEPFERLAHLPQLRVSILPRGGHLGFLGWSRAGVTRWAEERIVEWVLQPEVSRK